MEREDPPFLHSIQEEDNGKEEEDEAKDDDEEEEEGKGKEEEEGKRGKEEDEEMGKKKEEEEEERTRRRTRGQMGCRVKPPSIDYPDIPPPLVVVVRRALSEFRRREKENRCPGAPKEEGGAGKLILEGSGGGYYIGELVGGQPHGKGEHWVPFPCQDQMHLLYHGQWQMGRKTGVGVIFYTNGQEYKGELKNEEPWGYGCMRYNDGSFYIGDWLRSRKHGLGTFYYRNGNHFKGSFFKDIRDGWGVFYWPSTRRKFEGEWEKGIPYSGFYSDMNADDDLKIPEFLVKFLSSSTPTAISSPLKVVEKIPENKLRHPSYAIYRKISSVRAISGRKKTSKNLYKTQVERNESLSAASLQSLKMALEELKPNRTPLPVVHLRRLLVSARMDPDKEQGTNLLEHLQHATGGKDDTSFDDFLFNILRFHHP